MAIHGTSLAVAVAQFVSYVLVSTCMQYFFYYRQQDSSAAWKTQPNKLRSVLPNTSNPAAVAPASQSPRSPLTSANLDTERSQVSFFTAWAYPAKWLFFPSLPALPHRHPMHVVYATWNLTVTALFALGVTELHCRGLSSMSSFYPPSLLHLSGTLGLAILWQCVAEYYWHRWMHSPLLYRHLHKLHHHYTSPQPFDDLMIHPLEAFGYYCILYSPALLLPGSVLSFLAYMTVMGMCGVVDHCGVVVRVLDGWLYDSREHDEHHRLFTVNYSFPFSFMDRLHGTYRPPQQRQTAR